MKGGILEKRIYPEPHWYCRNCGDILPIRKYERKRNESGLTSGQHKTIERIRRKFLERSGNRSEYKQWSVELQDWSGKYVAIVVCEAGDVGDEGTMLAIVGRTRGQFFIFPSGVIKGSHIYQSTREVEKKYHKQWTG